MSDSRTESQPYTESPLYSVPALRGRGWSPAMIRDLLGDPDAQRPNPRFRTAAPMRLYRAERVRAAEATEDFARRAQRATERARAARVVADRKRDTTVARIRAAEIDVPALKRAQLARRTVAHRNAREEFYAEFPDPAGVDSTPPETLRRWEVNYLRHVLTPYDSLLEELYGQVGRAEAEDVLRRRIYAAIAERYPHLRAECDRQLAERLHPGEGVEAPGRDRPSG